MGAALPGLISLAASLAAGFHADTTTYADRATSLLVARAMARHHEQDSTVRDYRAKIRYRLSFAFGKRKWADIPPVAAEEQEGTVAWQLPNNLRVDLLGRRTASALEGMTLNSSFARPWFVPRTLGDSIRVFGSDDPNRAAPHPLAPSSEKLYHYAAGDSITITAGGRRLTIRSVTVTPKGPGPAFVAGRIWLDVATGDMVRSTFRYVGNALWTSPDRGTSKDSASAALENKFISRILQMDMDLEYGLQDNKYWMPYRQVLSGKISIPLGVNAVIPFEAATTFDDYVINTGTTVAFSAPFRPRDSVNVGRGGRSTINMGSGRGGRGGRGGPPPVTVPDSLRPRPVPDSLRFLRGRDRTGYLAGGGRFQIHRAPADSMRRYNGWGDTMTLNVSDADRKRLRDATADLAKLAEKLPSDMTGRPGNGIALERFSDVLRYNRVEGTTFSIGSRIRAPVSFTDFYGTLRYGFGDARVMARVAAVRDAPEGRLTLAASRDLQDLDAFSSGLTFGNSMRAILVGRDDGAYVLAHGARLDYETSLGLGTELALGARAEDQQSVGNSARVGLPRLFGSDGYFPENPLVREGFATGAMARIDHAGKGVHWGLGADALLVGGEAAGRVTLTLRPPPVVKGWLSARIRGGVATGIDSVPQLALRAGGINTVRGYDFGVTSGNALWSAQFDVSRPRGGTVRPVLFIDAGQAGNFSNFGSAPFLSGAGVGLSILGGFIRADLSHPLTERNGRGLRFDLIFGRFDMAAFGGPR